MDDTTTTERVLLMTIVDAAKARGNPRGNSFEPWEELAIVWLHTGQGAASSVQSFKASLIRLVKLGLVTMSGSRLDVTDRGILTAARWRERHPT